MLIAFLVTAVLAFVLAVLLVMSRRSAAADRAAVPALEGQLEEARASIAAAETRRAEAEAAKLSAEGARASSEATVSEMSVLAARLVNDGAADTAALWALERIRSERTWRQSVALVEGGSSPLSGSAEPLRVALEIEVAALREEVGAIVDLEFQVPEPVSAGASLATLRVAQELLAATVMGGDVTTVHVAADGADVVVRVETVDANGSPLPVIPLVLPRSRLEPDGSAVRLRDALGPLDNPV